jgi:hypothetical protein
MEPVSIIAALAAALSYFLPAVPSIIMTFIAFVMATFSFFYFYKERPGNILMFLCIVFSWATVFLHIYLWIIL